jgi:hypothetical protein
MAKITVEKTEISIITIEERGYISLTDMVKNIANGLALIENWFRNISVKQWTERTHSKGIFGHVA